MWVKVTTKFKDKYSGEVYKVGKKLNLSPERVNEILTVGALVEKEESKNKKETSK